MKKKIRFTKLKKEVAMLFVNERLQYFNQFYRFKIKRVSIRNQKTRWGSCSAKGNLNFNYKIIYLRKEIADYLIVHELCHLGQLNHSKKFWELVSMTVPNFKKANKELKTTTIRTVG